MDNHTTALERAFELAKSGKYVSVEEIKRQLKKDGHSVAQITGGGYILAKQLRAIIKIATSTQSLTW